MALVKAFDRIHTAADRSFLAACRCQSDSCSCNDLADGQTLFHTLQANKETIDFLPPNVPNWLIQSLPRTNT